MAKAKISFISYFPEIFQELIEDNKKAVDDYREKGLPKGIGAYYHSLKRDFESVAIGEIILNSDVIKSKQNFYVSAKMQQILFEKYDSKSYNIQSYYVTNNEYRSLFNALISENEELINSLALLFGGRAEVEKEDDELYKNVVFAVKYLILKDINKAKEFINELKKMENDKEMKYYTGYEKVLTGIIEKDEKAVDEGLKHMIKCHSKLKAEYGNTANELLSISVLGLAKLAILYDLQVTIDDKLAPKEMLVKSEMEYPIVDFVN